MTEVTHAPGWKRKHQPLQAARIPESLLTLRTASAVSGLSEATLYRKAASGELKMVKLGARCTRIRAGDLTAWLNAQGSQEAA
jgi:prophage regulatory protein